MSEDAAHLRDFYASPLGQLARRVIARRIRERWPEVAGMDVIGLGYASPYLRMFQGEARITAALMPQIQGVVQWPREGPYRSALVPGIELPLRMLIWSEDDGVALGYNDPRELAATYDVAERQATLVQMAGLLAEIAREAAA